MNKISTRPISVEEVKDELSVWSGDTLAQAIVSRREIFNQAMPDIAGNESPKRQESMEPMQQLLEESKLQKEQADAFDREVAKMNIGGVSAVARQTQLARAQIQNEMHERQVDHEKRARKRDMILAQNGMLPTRHDSDEGSPQRENSPPRKLGPSTIRTIIRAAESRPEADLGINKDN